MQYISTLDSVVDAKKRSRIVSLSFSFLTYPHFQNTCLLDIENAFRPYREGKNLWTEPIWNFQMKQMFADAVTGPYWGIWEHIWKHEVGKIQTNWKHVRGEKVKLVQSVSVLSSNRRSEKY